MAVMEEDDGEFEDDADKRVCHGCIEERQLTSEIERSGRAASCSYCNARRGTVSVAWLAQRIDEVYRQMVRVAREDVHFDRDGEPVWRANGETPSELIAHLIGAADTEIAADIVDHLGRRHAYDIHKDGDTDWYDDGSDAYALEIPDDRQFRHAWDAFCQSVKHDRRFFSKEATATLDLILGPILKGVRPFGDAVRFIGPEDDARFLYRARQANDDAARHRIYGAPIRELLAPPVALATAGRMNPAGISVFYASRDTETAMAELRVPVGGGAVVGTFEITRPLRLLDLTRLEKIESDLSPFHANYFEAHSHAQFLRGFHQQIRKPVVPGRESLEYLPTQVVAEYLWTRDGDAVDGVIFRSSQVGGDRENVVLFPRSCAVEGAAAEVRREITWSRAYSLDGDEPPTELVYRRPLPEPGPQPAAPPIDVPDLTWLPPSDLEPEPEPSLRLDVEALSYVRVEAIRYEIDEVPIQIEDDSRETDNWPF